MWDDRNNQGKECAEGVYFYKFGLFPRWFNYSLEWKCKLNLVVYNSMLLLSLKRQFFEEHETSEYT